MVDYELEDVVDDGQEYYDEDLGGFGYILVLCCWLYGVVDDVVYLEYGGEEVVDDQQFCYFFSVGMFGMYGFWEGQRCCCQIVWEMLFILLEWML